MHDGCPLPPPQKKPQFYLDPKKRHEHCSGGSSNALSPLYYTHSILLLLPQKSPFFASFIFKRIFQLHHFFGAEILSNFRHIQVQGVVQGHSGRFSSWWEGGGQRKMLTSPTLILCKINGLFPLLAFKSHTIIKIILGGGPLYKFFLKKKK